MTKKQVTMRLKQVLKFVLSGLKTQIRAKDLESGDVVWIPGGRSHSFVVIEEGEIIFYPIREKGGIDIEIKWSSPEVQHYGSKCQMWVIKKLLKPIKSSYETT